MALFKKKKEDEVEQVFEQPQSLEETKKMIMGVNPELISKVKDRVKTIHKEKEELKRDYDDLIKRVSIVEAKCDAIETTFNNFKKDLKNEFLNNAQKALKEEIKRVDEALEMNHSRLIKIDDELIKLAKEQDEYEFMSNFQDNYQLIKFCIYQITNLEPNAQTIITSLLQTIHTICEEMASKGFWETGKDAVITSMYNLKSYWRARDERVEALINNEIESLKILR